MGKRQVSLMVSEDLLAIVETLTDDVPGTIEDLLVSYVNRQRPQIMPDEERLDRVIDALNAFNERHGFLSDEFSTL